MKSALLVFLLCAPFVVKAQLPDAPSAQAQKLPDAPSAQAQKVPNAPSAQASKLKSAAKKGDWPRTIKEGAQEYVVYAPQVEKWDGNRIYAYSAIEMKGRDKTPSKY